LATASPGRTERRCTGAARWPMLRSMARAQVQKWLVALHTLQVLSRGCAEFFAGCKTMTERADKGDDAVIIKKYANRRLYNTQSSSYITLDHLAKMTRENIDYKVVDAKSGDDITHQILTQIIMDEEANGEQMLPVSFLRQLISMYGNSVQSLIPHYLEASMNNFCANQTKLHKAFEDSIGNNPLAKLAEQNMAMFKAATAVFMPGADKQNAVRTGRTEETGGDAAGSEDELATLRAQMSEIQKRLDSLGK